MNFFNKLVSASLPFVPRPIVATFARPYIAGETLDEAVKTVQSLNAQGAMATVDVLGEDITQKSEATSAAAQVRAVLAAIKANALNSNISIKLTQLGLNLDLGFCKENVAGIIDAARAQDNFVRVDMENHTCTDRTLEVYRFARERYEKVGIVIQAYLHRSEDDIRRLASEHASVRLCKGIYNEPAAIAIKDRRGIQQNYIRLLKILMESGCSVGIATHDDVLIDAAKQVIEDLTIAKDKYEFQMLLGVRPEKRAALIAEGHRLRVYTPFGKDWYGYSVRRLKENPEMAGHVLKAVFGIGK
ncbi:MAG TPA: proline dehydrogenase family protein [Bacteroidota bacterium]|nr:proline dehydrogenase family protein [Bacteroidota bacterium]